MSFDIRRCSPPNRFVPPPLPDFATEGVLHLARPAVAKPTRPPGIWKPGRPSPTTPTMKATP